MGAVTNATEGENFSRRKVNGSREQLQNYEIQFYNDIW